MTTKNINMTCEKKTQQRYNPDCLDPAKNKLVHLCDELSEPKPSSRDTGNAQGGSTARCSQLRRKKASKSVIKCKWPLNAGQWHKTVTLRGWHRSRPDKTERSSFLGYCCSSPISPQAATTRKTKCSKAPASMQSIGWLSLDGTLSCLKFDSSFVKIC